MAANMRSPTFIIALSVLALEVFVSIIINLFIAVFILRDWKRKRSLKSKDKIQVALHISGALFMTVSIFNLFSDILQAEFLQSWFSKNVVNLFSIYCICSSSWLTVVLCFFYFIKVVNAQWGFLVWVKMKISSIVPWQILVVELVSLGSCLLSLFFYRPSQVLPVNISILQPSNKSLETILYNSVVGDGIFVLICVPFVFSFFSTTLTVSFLKLHVQKMKDAMTSGGINLTLYKHVVHKMLRFLLLYSVFYLSMFIYHCSVFVPYSPGYWINLILIFLFNPTQAFLHILDNPKMRSSLKEMLRIIYTKAFNVWKP